MGLFKQTKEDQTSRDTFFTSNKFVYIITRLQEYIFQKQRIKIKQAYAIKFYLT